MTRPTLGLAMGDADDISTELSSAVEAAARELGLDVARVADAEAADGRDVVLGVGYPRYYAWLSRPLPATRRIAWLGEPLPPADEPAIARLVRALPMGRIIDGVSTARRMAGRRTVSGRLVDWRERAAFDHDRRLNLAVHRRAARDGIRLVVTSADRAASLRRVGIRASVVPFGYHPVHAGPPHAVDDADRDIDVLVLATDASGVPTRRARVLAEVVGALGPAVRVELVEGGAWGADRHRLIARARVVLNINRAPGNFTGIRTVLVGAAGAALVSEPVDTPAPFAPGVHYVEARSDELAAAVRTVLADRTRRLAVAGALQHFVVNELTMARSLAAVLGIAA